MAGRPNYKCDVCGKEMYKNPNVKQEYTTCSRECRSILHKRIYGNLVKCDNCGKEFYRKKSSCGIRNYCSKECFREANPIADVDKIIELHKQGLYDKDIGKILNRSRARITSILNKNGFSQRHSKIDDLELRKRISDTNRGQRTGLKNHNFKGNSKYTTMARGLFGSIRSMYMAEKNYTCEICGKRGGDLNVHHIKHFSKIITEFLNKYKDIVTPENFSELILQYPDFTNQKNLILLCKECHKKEHINKGE